MSKRPVLRYREEARDDIKQARDWYEHSLKGLGARFRLAVRECLEVVREHPTGFERVNGEVRRALLPRFPYAVFYEEKDGEIVVYSVKHTSRDDSAWRDRLG